MDKIISFGYWVQQRRLALNMTRPDLAQQVHCSPSTIKKIERDERRPSPQIADLLAESLLIPDQDRDRFIRMARGEFVATPLSAPDIVSLPPFLRPFDEGEEKSLSHLVAREGELAQLASQLEAAIAGNGRILFITGEAGDGKTMLAQVFAQHSQEKYSELVVVTGNCNAYTGIGDPYLPFREILELLTGDIEAHWGASVMSRGCAERLWRLVPEAVQALLEVGPDLVDTFLLGTALLSRVAATIPAQNKALLDQLQNLISHHQRTHTPKLHQRNLFAQYTRVLQNLARQHPLLLIVDDLQWTDVGSVSLLFHLSRHLKGRHILLLGIFRAAEVALGHHGERHPLEALLNELQRNFGEIQIRLNQSNGRHFVDALIDREANRLDQSFRDALYKQTAGHPLFTVEMLHGLQARGDIVRNDEGAWTESPELDWHLLPARVEGIIKERIGRLLPPLQNLLQVASVMGESFCAETIAHIQHVDEGQVISQLGTILDQEQGLVKVQGSQQIGDQQRSQFRFRHILFQQYLYQSLNQPQRLYHHRAIAQELAQCYGSQARLIAPQLAHHYARGGDNTQAIHYFMLAGDVAGAIYANIEAESHYRRALALAETGQDDANLLTPPEQLFQLYIRLGRILELSASYDKAIAIYEEMEGKAQMCNESAMVLASLLARAAIRTTVNFARDPEQGRRLLEKARILAKELGDQAAEAKILWNLLILNAYTGGNLHERLEQGEQALALARGLNLPEQLAFTLHDIFYAYAGAGQWERAQAVLYEAGDLWRRLKNLPMLSEAYMRLHWTYLVTGDYAQATAQAEEAYRLGVESHNLDAQALSHFMIGFVHWERGEIKQAFTIMEEDIAIAESVNSLTPLIGTRADLGLLYGELGDVSRGLELAKLAQTTAEEQLPILRFWPHAIRVSLHLRQGNVITAEQLIATLTDYQTVKAGFGYMPFMWIRVGLAQGEFVFQQQAFEQTLTLMDRLYKDLCEADIWYLRPDVLHLKGKALLGLGSSHLAEAHDVLLEARAAAESLGSRRALWPILLSLGEVERQQGHQIESERLLQQAQKIVTSIAHHIEGLELRTTFLNLPSVKAVLST